MATVKTDGIMTPPKPAASFVGTYPSVAGMAVGPHTSLTYTPVYRAVTLISSTIGSLPLRLLREITLRGRPARKLVPGHWASKLVRRAPNDEMTPLTWKEYMGVSLCLWGNSYNLLQRDGARGEVSQILPWSPDRVRIDRDEAGKLRYFVLDGSGGEWSIPNDMMLHVKLFGDGMVGKSPIQCAREAIGLGLGTESFGASFFGNGTMIGGMVETPEDLDDEAKANFKRDVESRHMGPHHAWRFMVVDGGYKYTPMGVPPKDSQFLESRTFQIQEVARMYGIPAHMLADNSRATFDNISQQSMEFFRDTIRHYLVRIEEEINRVLLSRDPTLYVKFETKGLLRADPETQSKVYTAQFGLGALSTNDILELEDRNPIGPEGDKRFISAQLLPLDHDFEKTAKPAAATDDEPDEPAEPPIAPETKEALRVLFRDATGRLAHRELTALRDMIERAISDEECDELLREWCGKHESVVSAILGPVWTVCEGLAGVDIVEQVEASRHVEDLRKRSLDVLRAKGRSGLRDSVAAWEHLRADGLLDVYLEMAGLNGAGQTNGNGRG